MLDHKPYPWISTFIIWESIFNHVLQKLSQPNQFCLTETLFIQQALWKKADLAMILTLQISKGFVIFCFLSMLTWVCPDSLQKTTPILLKISTQRVKCIFHDRVPTTGKEVWNTHLGSWLAVLPSQHRTQPKTCFKKNKAGMEVMDSLGMPSVFTSVF